MRSFTKICSFLSIVYCLALKLFANEVEGNQVGVNWGAWLYFEKVVPQSGTPHEMLSKEMLSKEGRQDFPWYICETGLAPKTQHKGKRPQGLRRALNADTELLHWRILVSVLFKKVANPFSNLRLCHVECEAKDIGIAQLLR